MMNYEKLTIKSIPADIKQDLIKFAHAEIAKNAPFFMCYSTVGFYLVPENLNSQLIDYYKDIDFPLFFNQGYGIQVIRENTAPHTDPADLRPEALLYILDPGGPSVETVWYDIKSEFDPMPEVAALAYRKLDKIESHILEEDCWHRLVLTTPHSVENIKSIRLSMVHGHPEIIKAMHAKNN